MTTGKAEIDATVAKDTQAFHAWRKVPVAERVAILNKFCKVFEQKKDKVTETIVTEMGRPVRYGKGEVNGVLERAGYMISVAEESLADECIENGPKIQRFLRNVPLGPVFIIAAWNYPYMTMGK